MRKKIATILTLAGIVSFSGIVQASLNDGLVAYYPFNGNANDESGNGNHGTENGGVGYISGINGQAINFDGIDDYIYINHDESLNVTGNYTFSFWVNRAIDGTQYVISKGRDCLNSYWFRSGGQYFAGTYGNSWCDHASVNSSFQVDEWHYITGIIDNTNRSIRYYLDGTLNTEEAIDSYLTTNTYPLVIGRHFTNSSGGGGYEYLFKGMIDELRIYNRALSESEIKDLYNKDTIPNKESSVNNGSKTYSNGSSYDISIDLENKKYCVFVGGQEGCSELYVIENNSRNIKFHTSPYFNPTCKHSFDGKYSDGLISGNFSNPNCADTSSGYWSVYPTNFNKDQSTVNGDIRIPAAINDVVMIPVLEDKPSCQGLNDLTCNSYSDANTLFDWAETQYPNLFFNGTETLSEIGFWGRRYPSNSLSLGVKNRKFYGYGDLFGEGIVELGGLNKFLLTAKMTGHFPDYIIPYDLDLKTEYLCYRDKINAWLEDIKIQRKLLEEEVNIDNEMYAMIDSYSKIISNAVNFLSFSTGDATETFATEFILNFLHFKHEDKIVDGRASKVLIDAIDLIIKDQVAGLVKEFGVKGLQTASQKLISGFIGNVLIVAEQGTKVAKIITTLKNINIVVWQGIHTLQIYYLTINMSTIIFFL